MTRKVEKSGPSAEVSADTAPQESGEAPTVVAGGMPAPGDSYVEGPAPIAPAPAAFPMPSVLGVPLIASGPPPAPLGSKENPLVITRPDGAPWALPKKSRDITEPIVDDIVRAIVGQDHELYPGGDAAGMSTGDRYFKNRWYLIDGHVITLCTLVGWRRIAHGMKCDDHRIISNSSTVSDWKQRLFGISPKAKPSAFPLTTDFSFSHPATVAELDKAILAIVAQDEELYPDGSIAPMSSSPKYFTDRRYLINGRAVTLQTLAGRVRLAKGMKVSNTKALSNTAIISDWKLRLFGSEKTKRDALPIELDVVFSKPATMAEIDAAIRAIVAQDRALYPGGKAERISGGHPYFTKRWYLISGREVTLNLLAAWVRIAQGRYAADRHTLPDATIIADWKRRLFGIDATPMLPEEFRAWVDEHGLADVVGALQGAPDALQDFVRAIAPELSEHQVVRLMRAFAEIRLSEGWFPSSAGGTPSGPEVGDPLIRALLARRELLERMGEEQVERLVRAFSRRWLRAFNDDAEGTVAALAALAREAPDPRVQHIVSRVLGEFRSALDFRAPNVRTELRPFQREGARFLSSRSAAILADEPGLGKTIQAIAAVEHLRASSGVHTKALVIAPASVKRTWADQLAASGGGHLASARNVVVIEGDREERHRLALSSADADYVIVNYEYLVGASGEDLAVITAGLSVKIVDEAQMVQNPSEEVLRAAAVRKISAPKTWYLTATPYFGKVEHIWTHLNDLEPGKHGTLAEFRAAHAGDEVGLVTMHERLKSLMLRRKKADVIGRYDAAQPLADQPLSLPAVSWVDPAQEGRYAMSPEQQETSLILLSDFEAFWDAYGDGSRDASDVNPLERMELLFKVLHEPASLGINGVESKLAALDAIVERRMAAGQKVVLFTNRREEAASLAERYARHGSVLFRGGLDEAAKERARLEFQDGAARVIVGTEAMMFGIDLTAADALVFAQMPWTYPEVYQMADRLVRLDPHHRKANVEIVRMVGTYPGLADADPEETRLLAAGSFDELLARHLDRGRQVYEIVMDLPYGEERLDALIKGSLQRSLFGDVTRYRRKLVAATEVFYPLYIAARSFDEEVQHRGQEAVAGLVELFAGEMEAASAMLGVYQRYLDAQEAEVDEDDIDIEDEAEDDVEGGSLAELPVAEMELLGSLVRIRNKHLRAQMIRILPEIIERLHERGTTLDEILPKGESSSPLDLLAWIAAEGETAHPGTVVLSEQLSHLEEFADTEERAIVAHRLEQALLKLLPERGRFAAFLDRNAAAIAAAGLTEVADILDGLAHLLTGDRDIFEVFIEETFADANSLREGLRAYALEPYVTAFGLPSGAETSARLAALPPAAEGFLDLARGLQRAGFSDDLARLKQLFAHVLAGDVDAWRAAGADGTVAFLGDDAAFWAGFNAGMRAVFEVETGRELVAQEIRDAFELLASNIAKGNSELERGFVWEKLRETRDARHETRDQNPMGVGLESRVSSLESAKEALRILHRIEAGAEYDALDQQRVQTFFGTMADIRDPAFRKRAIDAGARFIRWASGFDALREGLASGDRKAFDRATGALAKIDREYQATLRGAKDSVATPLAQLVAALKHRDRRAAHASITIEDTADWRLLLDIGRVHPDLVNCLIPSGNPAFTRTLVDLLGSRNKRMLVARNPSTEEILSVGIAKVRKDVAGNPVLHLERPFGRFGVRYEKQMLAFLERKRERMGAAGADTAISRSARNDRERERGIELFSTGSFGEHEYVEDLFGVRKESEVRHRATVVFPAGSTTPSKPGISPGAASKLGGIVVTDDAASELAESSAETSIPPNATTMTTSAAIFLGPSPMAIQAPAFITMAPSRVACR